jgi:hypothetical protein
MKDFKRCNNGHFYKESLASCPHCPADDSATQVTPSNTAGNNDKTQFFGAEPSEDKPTQAFGSNPSAAKETPDKANGATDFSKTYIEGMDEVVSDSGEVIQEKQKARATRKIRGWIVSFTLDPMGIDYRIFEGNNTIGRDPKNSICITKDKTISSQHVRILYRADKFYIKDEMTANGTYLNGEMMEVEKATPLHDGDEIKLGQTIFKFKSCL